MKLVSDCFKRPRFIRLCLLSVSVFLFSLSASAALLDGGDAVKGKEVFKANCAACHKINEIVVAPALNGIDQRWKGKDKLLIQWIQNPNAALASGDGYVKSMVDKYKAQFGMMVAQSVTEDDIKNILAYVKAGDDGGGKPAVAADVNKCLTIEEMAASKPEKSKGVAIWIIIIGVLFAIVAVSAANISKSLKNAINERDGLDPVHEISYWQAAKTWMWSNKVFVSLVGLFFFCYITVVGYKSLMDIGVYEGYQPEQPIAFSHAVHVCQNEIDCQYCHSSASKSKHAGIPSANVCMNCHKAIKKGTKTGETEIAKIYSAIGFNPESGTYKWSHEEQPIEWVKVHNLPDHVYFSHEQHVSVGKLDCKQCHGPVQSYSVGRQATVDEINAQKDVTGLIELTKPTLTMGWCIECHNKAEIDLTSSEYYVTLHERMKETDLGREKLRKIMDDGKVTVREMGGWECGKCHY